MRKLIRDKLPDPARLERIRWLQPLRRWLHNPALWHLNRRSTAGGVALGLFCGLIPGPLQMLAAALFSVWLRVNLPVALFTTLYTNPFTIVPLYLFAYHIGLWVGGQHHGAMAHVPAFPEVHWHDWFPQVWGWLMVLGEPLLIGLPLLALGLAISGYAVTRLAWRIMVVIKWRRRSKREGISDAR